MTKSFFCIITGLVCLLGCAKYERHSATSTSSTSTLVAPVPEALHDSPAFRANLGWHRAGKTNEIRMSWFLKGDLGTSMLCTADLSKYEVMTVREVHDWAHQNYKTRKLSHAQVLTLRNIAKALPKSIQPTQVDNIVIVSVGEAEDRKLHIYDRFSLPRDIVRIYDVTGAWISTDDKPQLGIPADAAARHL